MPIKDKELKSLLSIALKPDFVDVARQAKDKLNAANERQLKLAEKAFGIYINLWRGYNDEAIKELPTKTKELINVYRNNSNAFTRLRYNEAQNRLETTKGVQIPVEVAKRAYTKLNGCMVNACKDIDVPVMQYTITETTNEAIIAGCHTIPKSDINYIATLLKW